MVAPKTGPIVGAPWFRFEYFRASLLLSTKAHLLLVGPEGVHHRELVELRPAGRRSAARRVRCPITPQEHTSPRSIDTTAGKQFVDSRLLERHQENSSLGAMNATAAEGQIISADVICLFRVTSLAALGSVGWDLGSPSCGCLSRAGLLVGLWGELNAMEQRCQLTVN